MPTPLTSFEVLGGQATFAKAETANPAGSPSELTLACRHLSMSQETHWRLCYVVVDDCGVSCKASIYVMCITDQAHLLNCVVFKPSGMNKSNTKAQRRQATCPKSHVCAGEVRVADTGPLAWNLCSVSLSRAPLFLQLIASLLPWTMLRRSGYTSQAAKFLWGLYNSS